MHEQARIPHGAVVYLPECIEIMVSLKSIHTQTRQPNFITRNSKIMLTGLWVNSLERNHLIHTFSEIKLSVNVIRFIRLEADEI